jgi:prophage tail gpP-like protein
MFETITIDGLPPFLSIAIDRSAEKAVSTAEIELVPPAKVVGVSRGQPTTIKAGNDLLLTGQVRDVRPGHDANRRSLSVTIASKTVDAVECSADHKSGEILNKHLADIARELDDNGIGIEDDGTLPIEPRHKLHVGESLFHSIERRARGRGVLIHDTPHGKLKLATKPEGTHAGGLIWGENIKSASSEITERGRYSKVKVRGQASEGTGKQQLRAEASASDRSVKRKRTLIVRHEGETTVDRMKKRAAWHVKRGAGNGMTASITVPGWRDAKGRVWTPNWLVYVKDDWIGIDGMMIIKSVRLSQDGSGDGTTAALQLADPRALGGENPRGKTSDIYSAPGAIDVDYEEQ